MGVPRSERIRMSTILCNLGDVSAYDWLWKYAVKFLETESKTFRMYRGFWADDTKQIRTSNIRNGQGNKGDQWNKQDDGAGFSYSLSKAYAQFVLGSKFSPEFLIRHGGITEAEAFAFHAKRISKNSWLQKVQSKVAAKQLRPILGTYEVEGKDIIAFLPTDEEEIIATENVSLVRYDAITYRDAFASNYLIGTSSTLRELLCDESVDQRLFLHTLNERSILNTIKKNFAEYAKDRNMLKAEVLSEMVPMSEMSESFYKKSMQPSLDAIHKQFQGQLELQGCAVALG